MEVSCLELQVGGFSVDVDVGHKADFVERFSVGIQVIPLRQIDRDSCSDIERPGIAAGTGGAIPPMRLIANRLSDTFFRAPGDELRRFFPSKTTTYV